MWSVVLHPLVVSEDLPALDKAAQRKILRILDLKLKQAPADYGEPLRGDLHGFWKLRIGEYRVVYTIHQQTIFVQVVKIGVRRDDEVYQAMRKRRPQL